MRARKKQIPVMKVLIFILALSSALFDGTASGGSIREHNLSTGAPINATFMTGLNDPTDLEIAGSTLFVAEPSVVPEPTGIGLLCLGLASVVFHLSIRSTRPDS